MSDIIEQKAIDQALKCIDRLINDHVNPITRKRIIDKIQPLIIQAKKANDKFGYPNGFMDAVKDAYIDGRCAQHYEKKDNVDFEEEAEKYIQVNYYGGPEL